MPADYIGAGTRGLPGDSLMQRMLATQAEAQLYIERSRGRDLAPVAADSRREPAFSLVAWLRSLKAQTS